MHWDVFIPISYHHKTRLISCVPPEPHDRLDRLAAAGRHLPQQVLGGRAPFLRHFGSRLHSRVASFIDKGRVPTDRLRGFLHTVGQPIGLHSSPTQSPRQLATREDRICAVMLDIPSPR